MINYKNLYLIYADPIIKITQMMAVIFVYQPRNVIIIRPAIKERLTTMFVVLSKDSVCPILNNPINIKIRCINVVKNTIPKMILPNNNISPEKIAWKPVNDCSSTLNIGRKKQVKIPRITINCKVLNFILIVLNRQLYLNMHELV